MNIRKTQNNDKHKNNKQSQDTQRRQPNNNEQSEDTER
jgi:hypothetical protein